MKFFNNILLITLALLLLTSFRTPVSGAQSLLDQPDIKNKYFRSGEVLEYSAKVRGIPAGTQILRVNGKEDLDGYEVYHVESISRAKRIFSIFYPFDNRSESYIIRENLHPLYYKRKITDGGYKGSTFVGFDQSTQIARIIKDEKAIELSVPEGIQDELSMIYLLRSKDIKVGEDYEFPALVGSEALKANVSVLRIENLKTVMGNLKTIVIKAIPKDITMWLTHDAARIPVKIEASTKLGKLVFNLEEIR
jgi:hypothetical protein